MATVSVNEQEPSPIGLPFRLVHLAGIAPAPPVFQASAQTSTLQMDGAAARSCAGIAAVPKRCSRSLSYSDNVPPAGFEPALDGV